MQALKSLTSPTHPPTHQCFLLISLQGVNVRHRAKELLQLVNNPDRVREERAKVSRAVGVGRRHPLGARR